MKRSPSTPSESSEEDLVQEIAEWIEEFCPFVISDEAELAADHILNMLRSKGLINNG